MEENTVKNLEIEETDNINVIDEVAENSNSGAFVAGIVGGLTAYGLISLGKRIATFIRTKVGKRKHKETENNVIDVEFTDVKVEQ